MSVPLHLLLCKRRCFSFLVCIWDPALVFCVEKACTDGFTCGTADPGIGALEILFL